MVSSILIIAFSLVLLVYWFRYTCLLVLRTSSSKDYAPEVAAANNLAYPEVQRCLRENTSFDPLAESLARDYRLLTYLLQHTTGVEVGGLTVEQRMLSIDFKLMRIWYALTHRLAAPQARFALEEMSAILGHFANAMGERAAASSRA